MRLILKTGNFFSGIADEGIQNGKAILIEDDVIQSIGAWDDYSGVKVDRIIESSDGTMMPGLIDMHTHLVHTGDPDEDWNIAGVLENPATTAYKAAFNASRQLEYGVTTIRDLGSRDLVDISLRDAVKKNWIPGPRIFAAGHGITTTGGHMDSRRGLRADIPLSVMGALGEIADSADEARRAVRRLLMAGVDLIKINATLSEYVRAKNGECSPEMTLDMMQAICETAHAVGRKVTAHCHGGIGVDWAIAAGLDSLEHGRFLSDSQLAAMAQKGIFLIPTISPESRCVDHGVVPLDPGDRIWNQKSLDIMYEVVERAYQHGVQVLAGSDAGMPYVVHGGVAYEAAQLALAGLPNLKALEAMTNASAKCLGVEGQIGKIAPGAFADILVVQADLSREITQLQKPDQIEWIIQNGNIIKGKSFN
jgi:imidazolonepropionase-like amidohydrolase